MGQRFQTGNLFKRGKWWVGQWRDGGKRPKRRLGLVSRMTKTEAQRALAAILAPINSRDAPPSGARVFADFVERVFEPFYLRKWKRSTAMTNKERMRKHVLPEFGNCKLGSFTRDQLQDYLDRKAASGLSFSVVDHLRWDLKQVFDMAVAEGYLLRNPAQLIFTPRECPRPTSQSMTIEEVRKLYGVLGVRERLIAQLAIGACMRPGEIFAMGAARIAVLRHPAANLSRRHRLSEVDVLRKNGRTRGRTSFSRQGTEGDVHGPLPRCLVFPSEKLTAPVRKDNC